MLKINIYAVGNAREKYIKDAVSEYLKRLSRFAQVSFIETKEEKIQDADSVRIKDKEAADILKRIKQNDYLILLDVAGTEIDSLELAKSFKKLEDQGISPINIVIGGTLGLGEELIKRSNLRLSFSKLTFPHQIVRILLLEQLYRVFKINNHESYHH